MDNKSLRIPNNSKATVITIVCAAVMTAATLFMFNSFAAVLTTANFFYLYAGVLLIVFTAVYAKKNVKLLIAPLIILAVPFLSSGIFGILSLYYIAAYIAIAAIFTLTVTGKIKSKLPAEISFIALGVIAIILTVIVSYSFLYGIFVRSMFYIAYLIAFEALCGAYVSLVFALKDEQDYGIYDAEKTEKPKSVAFQVILTLITLGIYGFIWVYDICETVKSLNDENSDSTGEYLSLVFVPLYIIYWALTRGKKISAAAERQGAETDGSRIIYFVLAVLQLYIVCFAVIQNDLNLIYRDAYEPVIEETEI